MSLQAAVDYAETAGALMVSSAGSNGTDIDAKPHYPASINSSINLVVAASDSDGNLWSSSNYGKSQVQVCCNSAEQMP